MYKISILVPLYRTSQPYSKVSMFAHVLPCYLLISDWEVKQGSTEQLLTLLRIAYKLTSVI